jgi:hypothetical protein
MVDGRSGTCKSIGRIQRRNEEMGRALILMVVAFVAFLGGVVGFELIFLQLQRSNRKAEYEKAMHGREKG